MSQEFDNTKPASGSTTFGALYAILRAHQETLRSNFSGTSFPTSPTPVVGQVCFRTDLGICYVYTAAGWKQIAVESVGLGAEIVNARGSQSSLDGRLDVSLNEDGTLKAPTTLNPSEWFSPPLTFIYLSTTSFKVTGDHTDIYKTYRRLKINLIASTQYSEVVSSSFASGETTILILHAVIDATLTTVDHSLFLPALYNGAISTQMVINSSVQAILALGKNIAVPSGVWTDLTDFTEGHDQNNEFDPVTGIFTSSGKGIYLINAQIHSDVVSSNVSIQKTQQLKCYKVSGGVVKLFDSLPIPYMSGEVVFTIRLINTLNGFISLEAGDTLKFAGYQDSGYTSTVRSGAGLTNISILKLIDKYTSLT